MTVVITTNPILFQSSDGSLPRKFSIRYAPYIRKKPRNSCITWICLLFSTIFNGFSEITLFDESFSSWMRSVVTELSPKWTKTFNWPNIPGKCSIYAVHLTVNKWKFNAKKAFTKELDWHFGTESNVTYTRYDNIIGNRVGAVEYVGMIWMNYWSLSFVAFTISWTVHFLNWLAFFEYFKDFCYRWRLHSKRLHFFTYKK